MSKISSKGAVSRFRKLIINRAVKQGGIVSTVSLVGMIPSVVGSTRGGLVRMALESLIADGTIIRTGNTVYNRTTHHRVAEYRMVA